MSIVNYKIINFQNGILTIQFDNKTLSLPLYVIDGKYPEGLELEQLILDKINEVENNKPIEIPVATNIAVIEALVTKPSLVANVSNLAQYIRHTRARLLEATDWTQMSDSPLDTVVKTQWANYRLALRDITKQNGFPTVVNWPIPPAIVSDAYGLELTDINGKPKTSF